MNGPYVMLFVALAGALAAQIWGQILIPESKRKILEEKLQRNLNFSILMIFIFQLIGRIPTEVPLLMVYSILAMIGIPTVFGVIISFFPSNPRNSFALYKKIILVATSTLTLTAIFIAN